MLLARRLLQRARLASDTGGLWEVADLQWWWRTPRASDDVDQQFWVDDDGPVAGVWLTAWRPDRWQGDVVTVPGVVAPPVKDLWTLLQSQLVAHAAGSLEVPVADDDETLRALVEAAGWVAHEPSSLAWMDAADRRPVRPLPAGYRLVDRVGRADLPHPMAARSGDAVSERLGECPLHDPALDLAMETDDGVVAAYALGWADPVTRVGMVEPVRVEDDHQRRGLASVLVGTLVERMVAAGSTRLKIGFGTDAAEATYRGVGFVPTSSMTGYVPSR